jgi:ABC-2 type transport system permease protein
MSTAPKPKPAKPKPGDKPNGKPSLSGKPGGVWWLLQHELRLYFRRGRMKPKSGLILLAFLLSIWMLGSWAIFHRLGPAIPPPPFTEGPLAGLALTGVLIATAFIGSVMVSSAILGAVEAIYTRNDLDLLLSSPMSAWRVLIVRSSAIAVGALPLYTGLMGPPLLWLAIYSSPLWLSAIVFLITLAFFATGIALLIVTALFRLLGPRNTRVLAQIISALAGASIFLSFQYFNISGRRGVGPMSQEQMAQIIVNTNINPKEWWLFPARAFTGEITSILLWVIVAAIVFPVGVWIFSRSFVADAAAASAMGRKKKAVDRHVAAVRGGVMRSVVRKEFRLLARDPVLISQIGLQIVYLLPLGFFLLRPGGGMQLTEAAFVPALTLLSSALSGSLIWITVSAEDAPDLIASAPVAISRVDRAKLIAAVAPVWTVMAVPLIALWVRDWHAGAWGTAGVLVASLSSASIGLWRRNPGSRREFVRRRQGGSVLTSLGQTFVALGTAATVGVGAYGFPWISIIPGIIAAACLGALYKPPPATAAAT